jgi:hypothetical protein
VTKIQEKMDFCRGKCHDHLPLPLSDQNQIYSQNTAGWEAGYSGWVYS